MWQVSVNAGTTRKAAPGALRTKGYGLRHSIRDDVPTSPVADNKQYCGPHNEQRWVGKELQEDGAEHAGDRYGNRMLRARYRDPRSNLRTTNSKASDLH